MMFHLLGVILQWLEIALFSAASLNVYQSTLTLKKTQISVEDRRHSVCRNNAKIPTLASSHCKTHWVWWSVHITVTAAINHKLCNCSEGRFPVNLKPKIKVHPFNRCFWLSYAKNIHTICLEHLWNVTSVIATLWTKQALLLPSCNFIWSHLSVRCIILKWSLLLQLLKV